MLSGCEIRNVDDFRYVNYYALLKCNYKKIVLIHCENKRARLS